MFGRSAEHNTVWHKLREFETRDITSSHYRARHSATLAAGKSREISSAFIQAREYFRSASESAFAIRPLLLYYGVASLSRGLILHLSQDARDASLAPNHGLRLHNRQSVLANERADYGSLEVKLTKGLLHDLLVATNNRHYYRAQSSAVDFYVSNNIPERGSTIRFEDLCARVPELSEQYKVWKESRPPSVVLESVNVDQESNDYKITVSSADDRSVSAALPGASSYAALVGAEESRFVVTLSEISLERAYFAQSVGAFNVGRVVIFEPPTSGLCFSPLASCFVISYTLGMLCRYFPASWTNLTRIEKGDSFYPLAVRALDWIEASFPAMVVDVLKGPYSFEKE